MSKPTSTNDDSTRQNRTLLSRRKVVMAAVGVAGVAVGLSACAESAEVENPSQNDETNSAAPTKSDTAAQIVAKVSDVPVGSVFRFTDPIYGAPAFLLQPSPGKFLAYSAVCTHQGCIVDWNSSAQKFQCPCHGAEYDSTGAVVAGPAPSGLQKFSIGVDGDNLIFGA